MSREISKSKPEWKRVASGHLARNLTSGVDKSSLGSFPGREAWKEYQVGIVSLRKNSGA
jgi:hypothetical protein